MRKLSVILSFIKKHPLASKHPAAVITKFLKWQFIQLIAPGEKKVKFIGNTYLLAKKGTSGATGNIYAGLHDFNEMGFLLHFLRKEDTFADIGANIGSYTVLAAGYIGSMTIAFEPVPSTYESLKRNVEVNGLEKLVQLHNIAVSSKEDKLFFTADFDTVNHALHKNEETGMNINVIEVTTKPFDKVLKDDQVPALIKIDVEGFEWEVMHGMEATLKNPELCCIIIELNGSGWHYGFDESKIHDLLVQHQFQPYQYDPFTRSLTQLETYGSHNTIYIRNPEFVINRLKTAPSVTVFSETF